MVSPSGRVSERAPDWFFVATEACGDGTPDLGFFLGVLVFIGIFGVGLTSRRCPRAPQACGLLGHFLAQLFAPVFFIFSKNILRKFSAHSENFYFCTKNNTMVVLLKTASVRVSFIQIMQIRVQNKGKIVRKSRYDRDVSTPPSLTHCLSSSNSVGKLKVINKNFYKLFCSCLHIYMLM